MKLFVETGSAKSKDRSCHPYHLAPTVDLRMALPCMLNDISHDLGWMETPDTLQYSAITTNEAAEEYCSTVVGSDRNAPWPNLPYRADPQE